MKKKQTEIPVTALWCGKLVHAFDKPRFAYIPIAQMLAAQYMLHDPTRIMLQSNMVTE